MHLKLYLFIAWILAPVSMYGCGPVNGYRSGEAYKEANDLSRQGKYQASLDKYREVLETYPSTGDRALFEMCVIQFHPRNERKDYDQSLACFQELIDHYPASEYRRDSERMMFYLSNGSLKDKAIVEQQALIEALRQEIKEKVFEINSLHGKVEALEQKAFAFALQKPTVEKVLIEKGQRRLKLMSKGQVLKTYRVALGGNPVGPKERLGDNKTPEGSYVIDSRNRDSQYHLSLHISYPNEKDKKRAKELGVPPGGDIMIHGMKNGVATPEGIQDTGDWTKGCIAVTDEEIEEIDKLVPDGTVVEITP